MAKIPGEVPWRAPVSPPTLPETMNAERQTSPSDPPMSAIPVALPSPPPRSVGCNRHAGPSECERMNTSMDSREGTAQAVTAGDRHRNKDPDRLQRRPTKNHVNYGHASASQMKKLIARIPDIGHGNIIPEKNVAQNCRTYTQVASHPHIPIAGHRDASHLGEIAELGLPFIDDPTAQFYVDVATRFISISKIKNKEPNTVWDDVSHMWVKQYGLPERSTTDSCGAFSCGPRSRISALVRIFVLS